jgi:hypothetical protein
LPFSTQSVPTSCIPRSSSLASWNELPSNFNQVEHSHASQPATSYVQTLWDSSNNGNGYLPPPHHPGIESLNRAVQSEAFKGTTEESLPRSNDAVPVTSSSTVIPRRSPLEAVRSSPTIRKAAKLHVDVGLADISNPWSHEAGLRQRRERSGVASFSPYDRGPPIVPSSALSGADDPQPGKKVTKKKRKAPQEKTTEHYGAQRTFIFNPYNNPPIVAIDDDTFAREDLPPPLPEPCDLIGSPGPMFLEPEPPLQRTIRFSDPPIPDSASRKRNKYHERHTRIDSATGEKKPFLACSFCRQRKVCHHAQI